MRKQAIACAFFFLSFHATAQTYLSEDFSQGIPADFTLIDNDQLTPSKAMQKLGFAVGTPWIAIAPTGATDLAACSTSWYSPSGTADDWLITRSFTVGTDEAVLSWRAMASDAKHPDGYAVYLSTTAGTTPADFDTATPLFSVGQEEAAWTRHAVSMAAYVGQTVTVAFVNNSVNQSRLYVDDIVCSVPSGLRCRSLLAPLTPCVGNVEVPVEVSSLSLETIGQFTVTLSYDGQSFEQTFEQPLEAMGQLKLTLDAPLTIANLEQKDYTVTVSSGTDHFDSHHTVKAYQRKVLAEERTGTWCGWCVRGLVALGQLHQTASDWFVGAAVHNRDPMAENGSYEDYLEGVLYLSGYPSGMINRMASVDPGNFPATGRAALLSEPVFCAMKTTATLDASTREVSTQTTVQFAESQNDSHYGYTYIIIENDVHGEDTEGSTYHWYQNNAYAGGASGPMGGYESKPGNVPAEEMWYQEVVRGWAGDFYGQEGSVPAAFGADEPLTYDFSFALPATVADPDKCEVIVALIDLSDKHVVNCQVAPLTTTTTGIGSATASDRAAEVYDLRGQRRQQMGRGLNLVRRADGVVCKVLGRR